MNSELLAQQGGQSKELNLNTHLKAYSTDFRTT